MALQNVQSAPLVGERLYCDCGCGSELKPATRRNKAQGGFILPGQFRHFVNGHQNRVPLPNVADYLLSRSRPDGSCLVWTGCRDLDGYGSMMFRGERRKIPVIAWILAHGSDPRPLHVLHACDNPPCFRVDHLFLGTALENNRDAKSKGRNAIGERHGKSKLRASDIIEIRQLRHSGMTQFAISELFGVRRQAISKILLGSRWSHLPESDPIS